MDQTELINELEARVIERAKFWDYFIDMLIAMRDNATSVADNGTGGWTGSEELRKFRQAMQDAITACITLQRNELAQCFLVAGVGGERAKAFAKERGAKVLGEHLDFAAKMGYVPTYWVGTK